MNIEKQMAYWRASSEEDFDVARELVEKGRFRHGLSFAHLAVEKMLKAHVVKESEQVPPKVHNLVRLADLAKLKLSEEQVTMLREFNLYQLEGRYPEAGFTLIDEATAESDTADAAEMLEWLKNQL